MTPTQEFGTQAEPESNSSYWIDTIQNHGKAFVEGKLYGNWLDSNAPKGYDFDAQSFSQHGIFGLDKRGATNIVYNSPNFKLSGQLSLKDPSHILIASQSFPLSQYGLDTGENIEWWRMFTLRMLQHWRESPVGGLRSGHHVPLEFTFLLRQGLVGSFPDQVYENPDLIEEIFQGMYPGATTRGLKRVKTQTLKFCFIEEVPSSREEWEKLANKVSEKKGVQYSGVVGEMPYE